MHPLDQTRDRLQSSRIETLAEQLDQREGRGRAAGAAPAKNAPGGQKGMWRYRSKGMTLLAQHPGGGIARFPAATRYLCASHVTVLVTCFLHNRTPVSMVLRELSGAPVPVRGEVCACKHVQHAIHEVTVKFDNEIDTSAFVSMGNQEGKSASPHAAAEVRANVLVVEDNPDEQRLLTFLLTKAKAQVVCVATVEAMLDQLAKQPTDLIITDLDLGAQRGEDAVVKAREKGHTGAVIVASGVIDAKRLSGINALNVQDILCKPYTPATLTRAISDVLAEHRTGVKQPVLSSLDEGGESESLVTPFIEACPGLLKSVRDAMAAGDAETLALTLIRLKDGAERAGFERLWRHLHQMIATLEASNKASELTGPMEQLTALAGRLSLRSKAPAASAPSAAGDANAADEQKHGESDHAGGHAKNEAA